MSLDPTTTDVTQCIVCGRKVNDHSNPNTDYRGETGTAPPTDHYFEGGNLGGSDDKLYFTNKRGGFAGYDSSDSPDDVYINAGKTGKIWGKKFESKANEFEEELPDERSESELETDTSYEDSIYGDPFYASSDPRNWYKKGSQWKVVGDDPNDMDELTGESKANELLGRAYEDWLDSYFSEANSCHICGEMIELDWSNNPNVAGEDMYTLKEEHLSGTHNIKDESFESKANEDSYYLDDQTQYDGTPYQSQAHYVDYEIQGHFKPSDGSGFNNGNWSMVTCNHCGQRMTYDQAMAHMLNTHDTTTNAEQSGYTNFGGGNEENNWTGTFMRSLGESKANESDWQDMEELLRDTDERLTNPDDYGLYGFSDSEIQRLKATRKKLQSILNDMNNWTFTGDWAGTSETLADLRATVGESKANEDWLDDDDEEDYTPEVSVEEAISILKEYPDGLTGPEWSKKVAERHEGGSASFRQAELQGLAHTIDSKTGERSVVGDKWVASESKANENTNWKAFTNAQRQEIIDLADVSVSADTEWEDISVPDQEDLSIQLVSQGALANADFTAFADEYVNELKLDGLNVKNHVRETLRDSIHNWKKMDRDVRREDSEMAGIDQDIIDTIVDMSLGKIKKQFPEEHKKLDQIGVWGLGESKEVMNKDLPRPNSDYRSNRAMKTCPRCNGSGLARDDRRADGDNTCHICNGWGSIPIANESKANEDGMYANFGTKPNDESWSVLTVASDLIFFSTRKELDDYVKDWDRKDYSIHPPKYGNDNPNAIESKANEGIQDTWNMPMTGRMEFQMGYKLNGWLEEAGIGNDWNRTMTEEQRIDAYQQYKRGVKPEDYVEYSYESKANEDALDPLAYINPDSVPYDEQQGRLRTARDEQSPLDNIYHSGRVADRIAGGDPDTYAQDFISDWDGKALYPNYDDLDFDWIYDSTGRKVKKVESKANEYNYITYKEKVKQWWDSISQNERGQAMDEALRNNSSLRRFFDFNSSMYIDSYDELSENQKAVAYTMWNNHHLSLQSESKANEQEETKWYVVIKEIGTNKVLRSDYAGDDLESATNMLRAYMGGLDPNERATLLPMDLPVEKSDYYQKEKSGESIANENVASKMAYYYQKDAPKDWNDNQVSNEAEKILEETYGIKPKKEVVKEKAVESLSTVQQKIVDRKLDGVRNESIIHELKIWDNMSEEQAKKAVETTEIPLQDSIAHTLFSKKYAECNENERQELKIYAGESKATEAEVLPHATDDEIISWINSNVGNIDSSDIMTRYDITREEAFKLIDKANSKLSESRAKEGVNDELLSTDAGIVKFLEGRGASRYYIDFVLRFPNSPSPAGWIRHWKDGFMDFGGGFGSALFDGDIEDAYFRADGENRGNLQKMGIRFARDDGTFDTIEDGRITGYTTESKANEDFTVSPHPNLLSDYVKRYPNSSVAGDTDYPSTGGHFFQGLHSGDLCEAWTRADLENREIMKEITGYSEEYLNKLCYDNKWGRSGTIADTPTEPYGLGESKKVNKRRRGA